jgi:hypothetical protein
MLCSIGATEDAASGRAARPDGTVAFRQTLLGALAAPSAASYGTEKITG